MRKGDTYLNKSQRMQLKALACVLGLLLLLLLIAVRLFLLLSVREKDHIPVIRTLENVWVMEVGESSIKIFEDGQERTYPYGTEILISKEAKEQLVDIVLSDETVAQVTVKTHKINGKVLSVDDKGVELKDHGYYPFSDTVKGYRLYGSLSMVTEKDIPVGYDFADFVVENGEVCGILLIREDAMKYIRVLIKTGDYAALLHESVTFTCDTDFILRYGNYEQPAEEHHKAGEICSIDGNSACFQTDRVWVIPKVLTGKVTLLENNRSNGDPSYRGSLELTLTQDGIAVVNEVLLEEYLYSVVPSEMPASFAKEALKAQAICARTYAYKHMLHAGYPQYGAHVDDSTSFQVYHNIPEQEATTQAVKETYGQILYTQEQLPADTYYYSTSCGIGSDAGIWAGGSEQEKYETPDYLTPQPINRKAEEISWNAASLMEESAFSEFIRTKNADDYEVSESWYRWSYTVLSLNAQTLYERLKKRYEANSALVLTRQPDGSYESYPPESFLAVKNLCIAKRGTGGVAMELMLETDENTYKVISEYNIRYVLDDGETKVFRQDGSQASSPTLLPSAFFVLEAFKEKENVVGYTLVGGGYGHGVGMSQNGAGNMAEDGMKAEEILTFFYQGCRLIHVYENE